MEVLLRGMLENRRDYVRDRSEQRGACSGPKGGP